MGAAELVGTPRRAGQEVADLLVWASDQRSHMTRVADELRSMVAASVVPAAPPGPVADGPDLGALVRAAMARVDAEAAAARADSDAAVVAALEQATLAVRRADAERRVRWDVAATVPAPPPAHRVAEVAADPGASGALASPVDLEIDLDAFLGAGYDDDRSVDEPGDGDAFEQFWAEVIDVRPMRDRLRRWADRVAL